MSHRGPRREGRNLPGEFWRRLVVPALTVLLVFGAGAASSAEPTFPPLAGRVTDAAGVLGPDARAKLDAKLKAHEDKTSDQIVVATVSNLQGLTVEDYANRLFRFWKLGERAKNNGVLLLVAPNERKVRIEVGYGLEGALTDALSKVIIASAIAPRFKQGDFEGGVEAGSDAIVSILTGDAEEWQRRAEVSGDSVGGTEVMVWIVIFLVLLFLIWRMNARQGHVMRGRRDGGFILIPGPAGGGWSGGFSDGGVSGGGFSGGGGSSGGGGASGDW